MKSKVVINRCKNSLNRIIHYIVALAVLEIILGWCMITHVTITEEAVQLLLNNQTKEYLEIKNYMDNEKIVLAHKFEDDGNRAYNHYGLDRGFFCLEYLLMEPYKSLYEGYFPPPPQSFDGKYLHSAYEWAYWCPDNSFDYGNELWNWKGAISAYGYSALSKELAYERLCHVLHLLQDLSEPDHSILVGHPGSSKSTEELEKLMIGLYGANSFPEEILRAGGFKSRKPVPGAVGFEKLVEDTPYSREHEISELSVTKWNSFGGKSGKLYDYFFIASDEASKNRSDFAQKPAKSALGLADIIVLVGGTVDVAPSLDYGVKIINNLKSNSICIVPLIKEPPPLVDGYIIPPMDNYIELARKCTKSSKNYSAGLIQLFHDIVKHPPFVQEIKIGHLDSDENFIEDLAYKSAWSAINNGTGKRERIPEDVKPGLFQTCRKTHIEVTFGPFINEIDTKEATIIKKESVKVKVGVKNISELDVIMTLKKDCNNDGKDPAIFVGDFVPPEIWAPTKSGVVLNGYIEIYAEDIYNHYNYGDRAGENSGKILDADPATPAKVRTFDPPYSWTEYIPGWDKTHINIGSFILPPPSVKKIEVFQYDTVYSATWQPQCLEKEGQPIVRILKIETAELKCNTSTGIIVRFNPSTTDDFIKNLVVKVGIEGKTGSPVVMEKIGGNAFYGSFTPLEDWKAKWGFVEVYAFDNFDREMDSNPEDAPMLRLPKNTTIGNWDYYQPGGDLSYKGEGKTFFMLPSQ